MTEFIKSGEYVDSYRLARERQVIAGKIRIRDMDRILDMVQNPDGVFTFEIEGMTGDKGWPGAFVKINGTVSLICNRCNSPMDVEIDRDVVFRFAKSEEEADSIPIEEDDDTEVIVGSDKLKILDWIEEEILLSIPSVPVHDYECSELLREQNERDVPEKENPFAKLKDLKGLRNSKQ